MQKKKCRKARTLSVCNIFKLESTKIVREAQLNQLLTQNFPNRIEILKTKTYEEVKTIFIEANVLNDEDILKIKLKGSHLYNAIEAYKTNLQSGETAKTAKEKIITDLLRNGKVTEEEVAKSIAHWLLRNFIENDNLQPVAKIDWSDTASVAQFFKANGIVIKKDKPKMIDAFGANFPLVARQSIIKEYLQFILSQIAMEKSVAKTDYPIPFCAAGPGTGKTRLNIDMMDQVRASVKNDPQIPEETRNLILNNSIDAIITFADGAVFFDVEDGPHWTLSILFRILFYSYSGFSEFVGLFPNTFDLVRAVEVFEKYFVNNLTMESVIELLKWDYGLSGKTVLFYLGIDEFQKTSPRFLNNMVNYIGNYMFASKSCVFVPFLTGTAYSRLEKVIRDSTHPKLFFSLPLFSLNDLETIVNRLCIQYPIFQNANFNTNDTLKFYLLKARQVPRVLEYVLKQWKMIDNRTDGSYFEPQYVSEMYKLAIFEFQKAYKVEYTADEKAVLPFAIVNEPVPAVLINRAIQLFEKSCIVFDPNTNRIMNICDIFITSDWILHPELLLLNESKHWHNWENLVLTSFMMRLKSFVAISNSNPTIVSVAEMFGQVGRKDSISDQCSSMSFELSKVQYKDIKLPNTVFFKNFEINTIYKNRRSGEAVDGVLVLREHESEKPWLFAFKMKYCQGNSDIFSQADVRACYFNTFKSVRGTYYENKLIVVLVLDLKSSMIEQSFLNELGNIIVISRDNFDSYFAPFFHHNSLLVNSHQLK